ncbi:MAG: hypothetical protein ACON4G_08745 [Candidatus Puniceispirillaceae bacterium]
MANKTTNRPANVPEENVYNGLHWTIILGYGLGVVALAVLLFGE